MKDVCECLGVDYIEFNDKGEIIYIHGVTNKKKLTGDENGFI